MKNCRILFLLSIGLLFSACRVASDVDSVNRDHSSISRGNDNAGILTAGEWNDLQNWPFWNYLIDCQQFSGQEQYWDFYLRNRVSVLVQKGNVPASDITVELFKGNDLIWSAKSDTKGRAELWIDFKGKNDSPNMEDYSLSVNGQADTNSIRLFADGMNLIDYQGSQNFSEMVDLAFIVDATGSMYDEIEFLKDDLRSIIKRIKSDKSKIDINTATVFYRDKRDDYVVIKSDFTNNIETTIDFIKKQEAEGGGDYPEALHTALNMAMDELQWSSNAKSRIAFLLLDAPPHYNSSIRAELQASVKKAALLGIKIIPVLASGSDEDTEFLTRFFAIATNGTYVFLTDDSGVGNSHSQPSVGNYEVELLNDLLVRLVEENSL